MKVQYFICFILFLFFQVSTVLSQSFSAYTSVSWDQWQTNKWGYIYANGWCYAVAGEGYSYTHYGFMSQEQRSSIRPVGNAKDFYFRFRYQDMGLHEFSRKEWKKIKANDGWFETTCTFEYYITDQYPTLKSALAAHSWPCAKYYVAPNKPYILKSEKVKVKIHLTDDDEVRAINFFFDDCSFAISVHWDFEDWTLTYSY